MGIITDWKSGLLNPVVSDTINKDWALRQFDLLIRSVIFQSASECYKQNGGRILMTLSGGLDSSFCLAMIRRRLGPDVPIYTFTIAGSEDHPDFIHAEMVADLFHTRHHAWCPSKEAIEDAEARMRSIWPSDPIEPGDVAAFLVYKTIADHKLIHHNGLLSIIAHDGIDELLGGYWDHRKEQSPEEKAEMFRYFWGRLENHHLIPLEKKAEHFGIDVYLPYFQENLIRFISKIPLDDRTSKEVSKIPLREIAKAYLPKKIIERKKYGFCSALDPM